MLAVRTSAVVLKPKKAALNPFFRPFWSHASLFPGVIVHFVSPFLSILQLFAVWILVEPSFRSGTPAGVATVVTFYRFFTSWSTFLYSSLSFNRVKLCVGFHSRVIITRGCSSVLK